MSLITEDPRFPLLGPDLGPVRNEAVAILCVTPENHVLLQLRDDRPDVDQAGRWCFFGGGREPGETLEQTCMRELAEETGLTRDKTAFTPHSRVHAPPEKSLVIYNFALTANISPSDIRVMEGCGFGLFTARQLRGLDFIPHLRVVLETHFEAKVFATE